MKFEKIFSEDLLTERNGNIDTDKLKKARVTVLGLGGLGSNVACMLARSGVGSLHLVDFDTVEVGNLNRQQYDIRHIGMKKCEALRAVLKYINPFLSIKTEDIKITEENILKLVKHSDYICEALDSPESKAMVVSEILGNYPEKIVVATSGMAGLSSANNIKTRCAMKNLYVVGDEISGTDEIDIMMAPRVTACAAHEANLIIRHILGKENL